MNVDGKSVDSTDRSPIYEVGQKTPSSVGLSNSIETIEAPSRWSFGAQLRVRRAAVGESQAQFARRLGITQSQLSELELDFAPPIRRFQEIVKRLKFSQAEIGKMVFYSRFLNRRAA